MAISDYIIWFEDGKYIGTEIRFPSGSIWKLDTKIHEHSYVQTQRDYEELGLHSEARGTFVCSKVSGDGPPTAIIKIRMQIPRWRTVIKPPEIRAQQAIFETTSNFDSEIKALTRLTEAGCSSTPVLLSWKMEKQASNDWVPGGYMLCILMEKLPGSNPEDLGFNICPSSDWAFPEKMPRHERDSLRKSFKEAWLETVRCGIVHADSKINNLLWDREGQKCFIVDWEYWRAPNERTVWADRKYISWHLADSGPSHDYFDMSDWIL